jgi:Mg/Co/Ni transporter MgtE
MQPENTLVENFILKHTEAAVRIVEKQPDQDIVNLVSNLPTIVAARLMGQMDLLKGAHVLKQLDSKIAADLLEKIPTNVAISLFRILNKEQGEQLLSKVNQEKQEQILRSLKFPKDSVGAHMDPAIFSLDQQLLVGECVEKINSCQHELGRNVLIVDQARKLKGYVGLQELMSANPEQKVLTLLKTDLPSILADTRISKNLLDDFELSLWWDQIPVKDSDGVLLGVIGKTKFSENDTQHESSARRAWQASGALAELYQIGLTSLFRSTKE